MNQYFVAIQEQSDYPYIYSVSAKSLADCKDKLVRMIYNEWEYDFKSEDYEELRKELREDYRIRFGQIEVLDE